MPSLSFIAIVIVGICSIVFPIIFSFLVGGQVSLYVSPPYSFADIPDLTGKVAIVTGCNTGIGYVTARELARKGAKVIVAVRDDAKGKATIRRIKAELLDLPGANLLEYIKLDLSSFAVVRKFAKDFSYMRIKLDILILNAGMLTPSFGLTVDGLETHMGVNHFGHFLLVKLLTPIIKASKCRIVHVSSLAHNDPYPGGINIDSFTNGTGFSFFTSYGQSKLANILFSNELARQLNGTGVTSNSLHPGAIKTELGRHVEEVTKSSFILTCLVQIVYAFMHITELDSEGGALTQLYVATSPKVSSVTGEYFVPIGLMRPPSVHARNATQGRMLWEESERVTKPFW